MYTSYIYINKSPQQTTTCPKLLRELCGVFVREAIDQVPTVGHITWTAFGSRAESEGQKWLVGGWATPLKNMKVNWDDYSQYMGKLKMATKPPTSEGDWANLVVFLPSWKFTEKLRPLDAKCPALRALESSYTDIRLGTFWESATSKTVPRIRRGYAKQTLHMIQYYMCLIL